MPGFLDFLIDSNIPGHSRTRPRFLGGIPAFKREVKSQAGFVSDKWWFDEVIPKSFFVPNRDDYLP